MARDREQIARNCRFHQVKAWVRGPDPTRRSAGADCGDRASKPRTVGCLRCENQTTPTRCYSTRPGSHRKIDPLESDPLATQHTSSAPLTPAHSAAYPMAKPGYGKRSAQDQRPRNRDDFALLPTRERYVAGFVDHLPEGAARTVPGRRRGRRDPLGLPHVLVPHRPRQRVVERAPRHRAGHPGRSPRTGSLRPRHGPAATVGSGRGAAATCTGASPYGTDSRARRRTAAAHPGPRTGHRARTARPRPGHRSRDTPHRRSQPRAPDPRKPSPTDSAAPAVRHTPEPPRTRPTPPTSPTARHT